MDLICRRWPFAAGQKELRKKLRSAKIKMIERMFRHLDRGLPVSLPERFSAEK